MDTTTALSRKINIAIDGYSACGKSTLAKDLAKELGYVYIDSGAMYRAVTLFALKEGLILNQQLDKEALIASLGNLDISFEFNEESGKNHTYLGGEDVEEEIRKPEVASYVSEVSTIPEVRKKLVALQQWLGSDKGVVMDGRDIGTVVFPKAELKLFITASVEERSKRRYEELVAKGIPSSMEEVRENLVKRDHIDTTRAADPLRQAEDAILIDNTCLSKSEQLTLVLKKIEELDFS
ncbi:MAG: (d)CMP kinase [Luteibaculum sp.]